MNLDALQITMWMRLWLINVLIELKNREFPVNSYIDTNVSLYFGINVCSPNLENVWKMDFFVILRIVDVIIYF